MKKLRNSYHLAFQNALSFNSSNCIIEVSLILDSKQCICVVLAVGLLGPFQLKMFYDSTQSNIQISTNVSIAMLKGFVNVPL